MREKQFFKIKSECEKIDKMADVTIRPVTTADAAAIAEIYNYYVEQTTVTLEEATVSVAEIEQRITKTTESYPWLVAELFGCVVGYAYVGRWHIRSAFVHTVESSVYISKDVAGQGVGSALYDELFQQVAKLDLHVIVAGLTLPNDASVRLHEKFGFKKVGHFSEVGYKFGEWIDVGFWHRTTK